MLSEYTSRESLLDALVEIEQFVNDAGWDQPLRLFALVNTHDLLTAEPSLVRQMINDRPGKLSSIEQEDFNPNGADLLTALSEIGWPDTVLGCAVATERSFLTTEFEKDIPVDPVDAATFVANHPHRQDVRVVAGALRISDHDTIEHCVARVSHNPDDLLSSADMVPALTSALSFTLRP